MDMHAAPDGESGRRTRIMVVDDHCTFTDLVVLALDAEPDLECVGAAHNAGAARAMADRLRPDLVLMDVDLGPEDGLDLTAELVARYAGLRVVVLTAHGDARVLRRAAGAGACALLPKDGSLPELLAGLRTARPGGLVVHPTLLRALVVDESGRRAGGARQVSLTPREQRVLQLLAAGRDVRGISRELQISVNTCRGYVKALLSKLDAHSQLEAVANAREYGLIDALSSR